MLKLLKIPDFSKTLKLKVFSDFLVEIVKIKFFKEFKVF